MATLERIRRRSGLLIVVIGVAMLAFILTDLLGSGGSIFSGDTTTVGKVNGKKIDIQQFNQRMDEYQARIARQNPQQVRNISRKQLADGAWEEILREEIMVEQYEDLGITITAKELYERLKSDPNLRQAPVFQDPNTGGFSEGLFNQYVTNLRDNAAVNEEAAEQYRQWIEFERGTRNLAEADKYTRGIEKGLYVPAAMARQQHQRNNASHMVNLIGLEYFTIADSTVEVTDADLKKYYNEHKEEFKSEDSRNIEYVNFAIEPSPEDREAVTQELMKFKNGTGDSALSFAMAEDDSAYADMRSDRSPIYPVYYRKSNLPAALDSGIFNQSVGYVSDPYLDGNYYMLTKIMEIRNLPDSVNARHILIGFAGANRGQSQAQRSFDDAKSLADSLLKVVQADSTKFGELATEYSEDPGSAVKGGQLGWFADQMMVKPFSDFAFQNNKGDMKVVLSQFGFHIIHILDQKGSSKALKLVSINREIAPSDETYDNIYNKASSFANEVKENEVESMAELAQKYNYNLRPITQLAPFDEVIAGLGNNRDIVRWAHDEDTEVGDVTLINTEDQSSFVVVLLTDKQEEGYASMKSVEQRIRPAVINQKKAEILKKRIADANKSDMNSLAQALGVQNRSLAVSFGTASIPGFGNEPALVGAICAAEANKMSEVVEGERGVYVFSVTSTSPAAELPDYNVQKGQIESSVRPRVAGQIFPSLKEEATIKDKRAKFY